MREIKFRVWNTDYKFMDDDVYISGEGLVYQPPSIGYDTPYTEIEECGYPVMQCTGIKDKNGVEIYEGDIYHQGDPKITYTVLWSDTGLKGKQNGSCSYAGIEYWRERIEVIGNIYENKGLLETSK